MLSSLKIEQEVQANPPTPPIKTKQQGVHTQELERELLKMTVATQMESELVGKEEKGRSTMEVGMGDMKGHVGPIPGGWEMIWV